MPITIYQIDSFASEPFKGNPAAVCLLDKAADERWMQNFAAEMNLAETAYVVPEGEGKGAGSPIKSGMTSNGFLPSTFR